ncbi:MAG: CoA transferase [Dehalococcoidia bacterium]|nr:CoA transferase [Dehalococcoidia bacterium]
MIDLSDRLSGAFASRLFGDYGADVVLAEPPEGHPLRHESPFLDDRPGAERSTLHAYANWNKRSLVVEEQERLAELVAAADVVVTTAVTLDAAQSAALERLAPDAVRLSITAHGLDGPLAGRPGNNLTASARSGWAYVNGYAGEPPLQMPHSQNGYVGGLAGFVAASAALLRRDQGDAHEVVDVSEVEAFALTVHPWGIAAIYYDTGGSRGPAGGRNRGDPGPLYQASGGQINFGFGDWHNWREAMRLFDLPELGDREDLIPDIGRHSQDMSAVVASVAREVAAIERWPLFHALAELRCISGVVQDIDDIVNDQQLDARDFLVETEIEGRPVHAAGAPGKLSPSPWDLARPAPRLGQHERELRSEPARHARAFAGVPASAAALAEGPLSGVRVLSFCQAWAGTFGTELLALLGADVVQIETLYRADVWRRTGPSVPARLADPSRRQHTLNTQGLYNSVNLNKRAITLDLAQDRGREIFWELVPRFDILTENFRPSVLPNWGVTLETLNELRPGIVLASISAFGTKGPYHTYPGNGATTEPMSGFSSLHGYEGDPGMNSGGLYTDPIAAYCFAASVISALHQRDRTGEPQRVDVAMLEAMAVICGDAIVEYDATGRVPRPAGNRHPRIAPHNMYEARDGEWLALAAETEQAWRALVAHIGRSELGDDPRFATMAARKANEAALDEHLAAWSATQDAFEAESALGAIGLSIARVVPLYELYSRPDPNLVARGFIGPIDHAETGVTLLPGRPWKLSAAPGAPLRPAPGVGEHSREVLREELGITDDEYSSLVAAGIAGTLYDSPASAQTRSGYARS